jgi:myo-inositol-1(or 4)-monophosphatase
MNAAMLEAFVRGAEAAADVAGAVIRPLFRTGIGTDLKTDASPVTIADRTAEQAMRAVLAERFPGHGILGEEFGLQNPGASLRWVLDPIDGTRAFITGRPSFGTLIALLDEDVPVVGIIDQPVTGERWLGAAGRPTRFRAPIGGKAACRPCAGVGAAELSCTSPDMFLPPDRPGFERLRGAARRVTWGGDCYSYGLLALGLVDIVVDATMKIWDWAALVPVVEGAGGRVTGWRGETLTAASDGRVLAVGDPALLDEAVGLLTDR